MNQKSIFLFDRFECNIRCLFQVENPIYVFRYRGDIFAEVFNPHDFGSLIARDQILLEVVA